MPGWRFQLRGPDLLSLGKGAANMHQLAMHSGISYPTALRYISTPEKVQVVDMETIANILLDGLGLTPDEALNLKVSDLFELVKIR